MPNELYHHGIKDQKWGIRRFQNEDGSLTPEGELRYNQGQNKVARAKAAEAYKTKKYKAKLALKTNKQKMRDAAEQAKFLKKQQEKVAKTTAKIAERKKANEMTDEELQHEINRLGNEIDYNIKKYKSEKGVTLFDKLNAAADTTIGRAVTQLGVDVVKNAANRTINNIVDSKFDLEKVARINKINTETSNAKSITDATVENWHAQAKKHLSEAGKFDQDAKNSRAKTVSEINENRKKNAEDLRSSKALNAEAEAKAHQTTLTTKAKELLARKEAKQEHEEKYGTGVTSYAAQQRQKIADQQREAELAKARTQTTKNSLLSMTKGQRDTAAFTREQERLDKDQQMKQKGNEAASNAFVNAINSGNYSSAKAIQDYAKNMFTYEVNTSPADVSTGSNTTKLILDSSDVNKEWRDYMNRK